MRINHYRLLILCAVLVNIGLGANAQKLPNTQQSSLRTPANLKIDGKATEWNNQFQAYNRATDIFYTLSNDDNKLYLVIKATDQNIINRIIRGGITFTVNVSGKKNDQMSASVTYPVFGITDVAINFEAMPRLIAGSAVSLAEANAFKDANNKLLNSKSRYIMTTGIKSLDTLISLYNEDGITASESFDEKMNYTYELSASLEKLGINATEKFVYNIKLNGINLDLLYNNAVNKEYNDGVAAGRAAGLKHYSPVDLGLGNPQNGASGFGGSSAPGKNAPTDFWGEYTLAKK